MSTLTPEQHAALVSAILAIPIGVKVTSATPAVKFDREVIRASIREQQEQIKKHRAIEAKLKHLLEILPEDHYLVVPEEQP